MGGVVEGLHADVRLGEDSHDLKREPSDTRANHRGEKRAADLDEARLFHHAENIPSDVASTDRDREDE